MMGIADGAPAHAPVGSPCAGRRPSRDRAGFGASARRAARGRGAGRPGAEEASAATQAEAQTRAPETRGCGPPPPTVAEPAIAESAIVKPAPTMPAANLPGLTVLCEARPRSTRGRKFHRLGDPHGPHRSREPAAPAHPGDDAGAPGRHRGQGRHGLWAGPVRPAPGRQPRLPRGHARGPDPLGRRVDPLPDTLNIVSETARVWPSSGFANAARLPS